MEQYGVIGRPIGHSLSPLLHRLIYRQTGYRAEYGRFEVDPARIGDVVPAMRVLGIRGINVTSPHKTAILPYLNQLSPEAEAIGAANTVLLREDGTAYGDTTDGAGFLDSLAHHGIPVAGRRFVLCGSAGAGSAVRRALEQAGAAEVLTASTDPARGISYGELLTMEPRDVIVNCTPVGMSPEVDRSVVEGGVLARFGAAVDLVYSPPKTRFLRLAEERGIPAFNGLWMLIFQGIRSFGLWTGRDTGDIDADAIYRRLEAEL